MIEKDMQRDFKVWLGQNMPKATTVYELKMEKGRAIPFDRVADHQIAGLRQAKYAGMYHKISDIPFNHTTGFRFQKPKPFDCMVITKAEAYFVIMFYQPRQDKICYFIDVDDWIKEKENSSRKSLTEERAREISKLIKII